MWEISEQGDIIAVLYSQDFYINVGYLAIKFQIIYP